MVTVDLKDISEAVEMASDFWETYLNTETGELCRIPSSSEYIDDTDKYDELVNEIESSQRFIRLPNQYDINEYSIMKNFALNVLNKPQREKLLQILKNQKPFKHFKNEIYYLGIEKSYFAFRQQRYCEITKEWCELHNISYVVDNSNGVKKSFS